ncbi:MAG: hypothetical protein ACOYKA_03100 [Legionellaceae bacterium]
MLSSSEYTVGLNSSQDYVRLMILVYGFSCWMVFNSACPWVLSCLISGCVIFFVFHVVKTKKPYPRDERLVYRRGHWSIEHSDGTAQVYTRMEIRLDVGLFLLLIFYKADDSRTTRIFFFDQITREEQRMLYMLERINKRTT